MSRGSITEQEFSLPGSSTASSHFPGLASGWDFISTGSSPLSPHALLCCGILGLGQGSSDSQLSYAYSFLQLWPEQCWFYSSVDGDMLIKANRTLALDFETNCRSIRKTELQTNVFTWFLSLITLQVGVLEGCQRTLCAAHGLFPKPKCCFPMLCTFFFS